MWDESKKHENLDKLDYDVFLSPHQCSKSAMYDKSDEGEEERKQDILDDMEESAHGGAYIIASSDPIPATNKSGDNPPHAKAKSRYTELVESEHFLCTGEHPDEDCPKPVPFELTDEGLKYAKPDDDDEDDDDGGDDGDSGGGSTKDGKSKATAFGIAIQSGRGRPEPPAARVGFGFFQ